MRDQLAPEFRELRALATDGLMYIKVGAAWAGGRWGLVLGWFQGLGGVKALRAGRGQGWDFRWLPTTVGCGVRLWLGAAA